MRIGVLIFAAAAFVAGPSAVLIQRRRSVGTLLVAVGMSALLSRLGAVILLVGETWRVLRGSTAIGSDLLFNRLPLQAANAS